MKPWERGPISEKIREYRESGFLEDLNDLYFQRSRCSDGNADGQLQGKASSMIFQQHAGLYLLLVVGIIICVMLMFMEHGLFKWMVPYWRRKPPKSFWRSLSMLFWSQRLYRIITSEELVSPHHSAREMIEVVRNRDFTKLFQKSVKKQEKNLLLKSSKNLFRVVEQLQLKTRRDERLSHNPSTQTEGSMDSDNSVNPAGWNRDPRSVPGYPSPKPDHPSTSEDTADDTNHHLAQGPSTAKPGESQVKRNKPSLKEAHACSIFSSPVTYIDKSNPGTASDTTDCAKSDDELLQASDADVDVVMPLSRAGSSKSDNPYKLLQVARPPGANSQSIPRCDTLGDRGRPYCNVNLPLLGRATSSSEDNLASLGCSKAPGGELYLPNGMVLVAPNGDVFSRSSSLGKKVGVRPKTFSNYPHATPNLPDTLKTLPVKEHRVKSALDYNKSRESNAAPRGAKSKNSQTTKVDLDHLSKEDLFLMWKTSESELGRKLKQALKEKVELEKKLSEKESNLDT